MGNNSVSQRDRISLDKLSRAVLIILILPAVLTLRYPDNSEVKWIVIILTVLYGMMRVVYITNLEPAENSKSRGVFPYHRWFIGVNQWVFIPLELASFGLFGLYDKWDLAILVLVAWFTNVLERFVRNRRKLYNLTITDEMIIIKEDSNKEISLKNISSIDSQNEKVWVIKESDDRTKHEIVFRRIDKSHRAALKEELLKVESQIIDKDIKDQKETNQKNQNQHVRTV